MIFVNYRGGLGNRLFMYSLGRILAESLNLSLQADPIPGFAGTYDQVGSHCGTDQQAQTLTDAGFSLADILQERRVRKIVLNGYFQRYEYLRPFKREIQGAWLRPVDTLVSIPPPHPDDLVMHVRRGDYVCLGWALPFSFYEQIIRETSYRRLIIVTDAPQDPFFWRFAEYRPEILSLKTLEAFSYLRSARKLAISASTFSWWAGFLSAAKIIYFPKPLDGIWSDQSITTTGINLFVDDESRYVIRQSLEVFKPNSLESVYYNVISQISARPRLKQTLARLRLIHEADHSSIRLGPRDGK